MVNLQQHAILSAARPSPVREIERALVIWHSCQSCRTVVVALESAIQMAMHVDWSDGYLRLHLLRMHLYV